jgi:hypothetical protein
VKKSLFLIPALAVFLLPNLVFAAWWNPTSWFSNKPTQTSTTTNTTTINVAVPTSIPNTKVKTTPNTTSDSQLESENKALQLQISSLQSQLINTENQLASCNQKTSTSSIGPITSTPEIPIAIVSSSTVASLNVLPVGSMHIASIIPTTINLSQVSWGPHQRPQITVYGSNFWSYNSDNGFNPNNVLTGNGPQKQGPLIYYNNMTTSISVDSYSQDGTSLTFTVPGDAISSAEADSSGKVGHYFTFKIVTGKTSDEFTIPAI